MRIIVVDDDRKNLESARQQFTSNHELTLASSIDEALKLLEPRKSVVNELIVSAGFSDGKWGTDTNKLSAEERTRFYAACNDAERSVFATPPPFDVALFDLFMPASASKMGKEGMKFLGEPTSYGYPLALYAIKRGINLVGILSYSNHHDHPIAAAGDSIFRNGFGSCGSLAEIPIGEERRFMIADTSCGRFWTEAGEKDWSGFLAKLLEK